MESTTAIILGYLGVALISTVFLNPTLSCERSHSTTDS